MDFVVKDKLLAGNCSKLGLINACWLYQKVLWVHDLLLEASHDMLDGQVIWGTKISHTTSLVYPVQRNLPARAFTLWEDFMFQTFVTNNMT
jgi:hypothetical protein